MPSSTRYDSMPYRRCGRSGLKLPPVSLGLWHNFGEGADPVVAREMIVRSFDAGITHFDLANNYGPPPGGAETTLGRILRDDLTAHRDELVISTKAGFEMWAGPYGEWGSRKHVLASLDQSLRRLQIDCVDIFYSHRPDPETPLEETMGALATAVKSGKALYVGVSNYDAQMTQQAAKLLQNEGIHLLIHQPVYNLLNRSPEGALADALQSEGIGCIAFSPLAQGILAGRYLNGIPNDSRAVCDRRFLRPKHITDQIQNRTRALAEIASARSQTLAQMSIAWLLARPFVTSVLAGASRWSQIEENLAATNNTNFTNAELAAIDHACTL